MQKTHPFGLFGGWHFNTRSFEREKALQMSRMFSLNIVSSSHLTCSAGRNLEGLGSWNSLPFFLELLELLLGLGCFCLHLLQLVTWLRGSMHRSSQVIPFPARAPCSATRAESCSVWARANLAFSKARPTATCFSRS